MTIVIDYDSDAVRIGPDSAFDTGRESDIIVYKIAGSMKQIQELVTEVLNAASGASFIFLKKQDDGEITTIEEY